MCDGNRANDYLTVTFGYKQLSMETKYVIMIKVVAMNQRPIRRRKLWQRQ